MPKGNPDGITKDCKKCGASYTAFGRSAGGRKYCDEHYVGDTAYMVEGREKEDGFGRTRMICALKECTHWVPLKRAQRGGLYCKAQHQEQAAVRRAHAKRKADDLAKIRMLGVGEDTTERKGDAYQQLLVRKDLVDLLNRGEIKPSYVAHLLGFSTSAISRAYQAVRTTMKFEELKADWRPVWRVRAMLPAWKLMRLRELGPQGETEEEFQSLVDELVHAYAVFSRYYFNLEGRRPINEPFHLIWIRSIIVCYAIGGKQNIQSPPRHGKSEMLVRFCVWLIVMFPNIRIMWVAANSDVAKLMLGAVKDHLANNENLITDILPPGDTFRPDKN